MARVNAEDKYRQMTETPIRDLILKLSVPTIITNMISTIYNAADTYFIGRISTSASAAVGVCLTVQIVIQSIGFFFGQGTGTTMSKELGKHNVDRANQVASTGFLSAFLLSFCVMIPGLLFKEPIARFLGSTETILPYALDYMHYILLAAPFMAGSIVLNQQLRFQGFATSSMIGITAGGILNMFMDPIFIFTMGMGIKGAALSTMISQMVSFTILLVLHFRVSTARLSFKAVKISRDNYKPIYIGGLPSLCRQSVHSVAMIALNTAAKPFGDAAIAAMSITNKVAGFTNSIVLGIGQAYQPVCGFNYGAKKYDRVKEGFWFCVRILAVILFCIALMEFCFPAQIIGFFRKGDPEVVRIGKLALRLRSITITFSSWIMISNMLLQTTGKVYRASILGFARQGIVLIPIASVLPPLIGMLGIQIAQPIADIVTLSMSIPMTLGVLRAMKEETNSPPSKSKV